MSGCTHEGRKEGGGGGGGRQTDRDRQTDKERQSDRDKDRQRVVGWLLNVPACTSH